ncbi:hypothetical protein HGRIS_011914 [Hohenbuehelia grisea]|uniref:Uncharacterized protein n=1 Tax=Hohenbuehelia grisea TaxID=104357 RepID=A0ABR3JYS3_9AGAR
MGSNRCSQAKSVSEILDSDDFLNLSPSEALRRPRSPAEETDAPIQEPTDEFEVQARSPTPSPAPEPRSNHVKRKRASMRVEEPGPDISELKITYQLKIATKSELSKAPAKRQNKGAMLVLSRCEPWDTIKAQFLSKIAKTLKPLKEHFEDYEVQFTVPRIATEPKAY